MVMVLKPRLPPTPAAPASAVVADTRRQATNGRKAMQLKEAWPARRARCRIEISSELCLVFMVPFSFAARDGCRHCRLRRLPAGEKVLTCLKHRREPHYALAPRRRGLDGKA